MFGEYRNIKISGIASVAPERVVDNLDIVGKMGSKRAKRQVQLTGINRRHLCQEGQAASHMATVAAERLLEKLDWDRDDIKVLVFVTQSPDVSTPATAMLIQKRLKIGVDCLAFDVNLGCTGYVSGLQIIAALLGNIKGKGLLLVGDGKYYEGNGEATTTDGLLFGDGASATALEYEEGAAGFLYSQYTDGSRHQLLTMSLDGDLYMDGNAILLFSLDEVSKSIIDMRNHFQIDEGMVDYYILHQAQKLILDGIANECDIENEKVLISYDEFGNTSTATIPFTICNNESILKQKGRVGLFLSGFGVGLAWANVYITVDTDTIMPVELSDFVYGE